MRLPPHRNLSLWERCIRSWSSLKTHLGPELASAPHPVFDLSRSTMPARQRWSPAIVERGDGGARRSWIAVVGRRRKTCPYSTWPAARASAPALTCSTAGLGLHD